MKKTGTKIGYILGTFPCRSETFILREIRYLRELGIDVSVLAVTRDEYETQDDGIKILYKPSVFSYQALSSIIHFLIKYPLAFPKLLILVARIMGTYPREALSLIFNLHTISVFVRFLDKEKIYQIHALFLSWPSIIGLSISIATGRQFSVSAHARDIFVEHGAIELKASYAKFITACTYEGLNYLKDSIAEKYHNKLFLNYHVINCDETFFKIKELSTFDSKSMIIAVGRLVPKKGFKYLIGAFALVIEHIPNCELVIVGEGPERKGMENQIKSLGLEQNARLIGWQKNDATLKLINQAAVLVVPSIITRDGDRDGIPNVVLEAFTCGTPVIASKLSSISEVIEHQKTGLLTEPENVIDLASAIRELLSNRDLQNKLAREAHNIAIEQFNPIKNTKRLASLLQGTSQ